LSVVTLRPTGPPSSCLTPKRVIRAVTGIISEIKLPQSPMLSGHPDIPSTNKSMNWKKPVRNCDRPSKKNRPKSEHPCKFSKVSDTHREPIQILPNDTGRHKDNSSRRFLTNKRAANWLLARRPNV
jgi:hypothetical protein